MRRILPKEGDSVERVAGGAPIGMGNDAPPQGDVGAALSEGCVEDTAIPEIPLSDGLVGEVPLPPKDGEL